MWAGALIVNMAAFLGVFLLMVVGGLALTWPDVPWVSLTIATVVVGLVLPVVFYPISKSIWSGMVLAVRPLEPEEQAAAEACLGGGGSSSEAVV